jgi:capsular polysaccharide biosynthesis protein
MARTWVRVLSTAAVDRWVWARMTPRRDAALVESVELAPETRGISLAPRMAFEPHDVAERADVDRPFPPVRAHRVADGWVDARSSSVVAARQHILSDWAYDNLAHGRIKGASLLAHDQHAALHVLPRAAATVDRGIHLGGYHSQNWYHWVAEVLPRLSLLDRLPEEWRGMPLLVPEWGRRPDSFREVLDLVAGQHPIVLLDEARPTLVRDLVVIDDLILHTPGFAVGSSPRTDLELMSFEGMQRYRTLLRRRLGLDDRIEQGLRIFIDRQHDPERSYNREEVLAVAQGHGFRSILAERLSFREQAALFSRAECILGANGAGWTNVLFASPGASGLCWLVRDGLGGPWFRNLASLAGVGISYLEVEPRGEGNPLKVDYWVDPHRFDAAIREVIAQR